MVQAVICQSVHDHEHHNFGFWTLSGLKTETFVGTVGFRFLPDGKQIEILYSLEPEVWGQGLACEAAQSVMEYAFDHLGFSEILAGTDAPNVRSLAVIARLGMTPTVTPSGVDPVFPYFSMTRDQFLRNRATSVG